MICKFSCLIAILFLTSLVSAQPPEQLWYQVYDCDLTAEASDLVIDETGCLLAGDLQPSLTENKQVYVIKTDLNGNFLWDAEFGYDGFEIGRSACATNDGGYVICGYSTSLAPGVQVYLVKIDSDGNLEWDGDYGGAYYDAGFDIIQTQDGGYAICGQKESALTGADIYLLRLNNSGGVLWEQSFGGIDYDRGMTVCQAQDGGFLITGESWSLGGGSGYSQIAVIKTDSQGNTEWQQEFGGRYDDLCSDVVAMEDGSFVLGCTTESFGAGEEDIWLIEIDSQGQVIWENLYGGNIVDNCDALCVSQDGGIIIAGSSNSTTQYEMAYYAMKVDPFGQLEWTFEQAGDYNSFLTGVKQTEDGNYLFCGTVLDVNNHSDYSLMSLSGDVSVVEPYPSKVFAPFDILLSAYPNPFNPTTTLSYELRAASDVILRVTDIQGREVKTLVEAIQSAGQHIVIFDASDIASGSYIVELKTDDLSTSKQITLVK